MAIKIVLISLKNIHFYKYRKNGYMLFIFEIIDNIFNLIINLNKSFLSIIYNFNLEQI